MAGPAWLAATLAAIMLAISLYCASRLVVSRRRHRPTEPDVDIVHVVMGVAMAGMLVPRLNPLGAGGWEAAFGLAAAWFGWQVVHGHRGHRPAGQVPAAHEPAGHDPAGRLFVGHDPAGHPFAGHGSAHHVPHLLGSGAMLYMLLAVSTASAGQAGPATAMPGPAGSVARLPTLALVLTIALFGYAVWTTDKLSSLAPVAARATGRLQLPAGTGTVPALSPLRQAKLAEAGSGTGGAPPVSPRLAACCEIAMAITMGYMLIMTL